MFEQILEALRDTDMPVYDTGVISPPGEDYIVLAMSGQGGALWSDGHCAHQSMEATADLWTHSGGRRQMQKVQAILNEMQLSWTLNNVFFEPDSRLTHWEWVIQWEE